MNNLTSGLRTSSASLQGIKYALFDIDNTLVDNETSDLPSERFCQAVAAVQERGVAVGIASARPLGKVKHIIDYARLRGVSILSNGAQLYDPAARRMIRELTVDMQATLDILSQLRTQGIVHWVLDDGEDYFWAGNSPDSRRRNHDDLEAYEKSSDPWSMPTNETAIALAHYRPSVPYVIVAREVSAQVLKDLEAIGQRYADRDVAVLPAHEKTNAQGEATYDVFLLHARASKRDALPLACEAAGVALAETMMVGDGLNDIAILEQTGIAVAVANAHPAAKAVATHLAPSWRDDGAAIAIENLLLDSHG